MEIERDAIKARIRGKVLELAKALGFDATGLQDDDLIPKSGFLDSVGILELVVWYDDQYKLSLTSEEINTDNLGSLNAMVDFLVKRQSR